MKIKNYFHGRINRRDFVIGIAIFNSIYALIYVIALLFFFQNQSLQNFQGISQAQAILKIGNFFSIFSFSGFLFNTLSLLVILLSLGICVRRFHDIGRSGKLVLLIPIAYVTRITLTHIVHFFLVNSIRPSPSDLLLFKFSDIFSVIILLIFIYLTIQEGQKHKNQYGEVPVNMKVKKILLN